MLIYFTWIEERKEKERKKIHARSFSLATFTLLKAFCLCVCVFRKMFVLKTYSLAETKRGGVGGGKVI
jgi:hypothetical protein